MATGRLPDPNSSPLTAKGDLYTYSTVPAKLAVGSNGETLVADSSQTTGLRYNPPAGSLANPIINGGMDIWQRGTTSATTASIYTADRWQKGGNTHYTHSRQTVSDTTNLPTIQYSLRAQRTASSTNTGLIELSSSMETTNCIPFAGRTVTLSFYARAGANYSATSNVLVAQLYTATSTDGNLFAGGFTGSATPLSSNVTLTTTWQRFAVTGTISSTATQLAPYFYYTPTGTAGANDWFEITGIQLDIGTWTASTVPAFRRSAGTLAGELAACQRYFINYGTNGNAAWSGYIPAAVGTYFIYNPFPVEMRIQPTVTIVTSSNSTNMGAPTVANSADWSSKTVRFNGASNGTLENRAFFIISTFTASAEL